MLDALEADGLDGAHDALRRHLESRTWRAGDVRPAGGWELAVCSRLPVRDRRELPMGEVFRDHAEVRNALACTVSVGDAPSTSSGCTRRRSSGTRAPITHMRNVGPQLPADGRAAVVAGDFNFWGPAVVRLLPGWKRAVRGRTYPAHRPHSQIDHVLVSEHVEVLRGEVLPASGSDHRPVRARLAVR